MSSKVKPYVLLVAELIYSKICEIKKMNPDFSNINAIETFIGTETYNQISSGKFHEDLIKKLEKNEAIDKKLLRYLTVRVKKFDLETNYFGKKEDSEKRESAKN